MPDNFPDPMHFARMAQLEAALLALLREAQREETFDEPDGISAHLTPAGLDVTYWLGGIAVSGEGT